MQQTKKKGFFNKIKTVYRLVILKEDNFEEKLSIKLSPLALFNLVSAVCIILIVIVIATIAFTPLKQYIPGYGNIDTDKKIAVLLLKADSLESVLELKSKYIENINAIISGKSIADNAKNEKRVDTTVSYQNVNIAPSKEDSIFRRQVEEQDKYTLSYTSNNFTASKDDISNLFFFTPVSGIISNSYNYKEEHFGTDIAAKENEPVKAIYDGTVIFAAWTVSEGNVIHLQHTSNLLSVYKHNATLLKKAGQTVKAGEVIAIVGNSGELSTDTHLHFELWHNGTPVNPQDYINF